LRSARSMVMFHSSDREEATVPITIIRQSFWTIQKSFLLGPAWMPLKSTFMELVGTEPLPTTDLWQPVSP
ncbi:hypothetical protein, partial [uncultured Gimesia sp.]|uniref:hypothetical protein n=1 Tax=uncultured Gimesia sp. TaxID=1678688 RepID=UPI0030D7643D